MWVIDQLQKHRETALDTLKNGGTESSFPVKMHLIVHHNAWPSVKSYGFTDEVVKMGRIIRKMAGFHGRLKETCSNHPFGAANVVQKPKENRKPLISKVCDCVYPEPKS